MVDIYNNASNNVLAVRKNARPSFGAIRVQSQNGNTSSLVTPVIFNQFVINYNEKVQVLESFNEVVHIYAYGKGAGSLTLGGMVLATCDNRLLANTNRLLVKQYENQLRAFQAARRGDLVKVSGPGGIVGSGVVVSLSVSANAENDNKVDFQLNMITASSAFGFNGGNAGEGEGQVEGNKGSGFFSNRRLEGAGRRVGVGFRRAR